MPIESREEAQRLALEYASRGWRDAEDPIEINEAASHATGYGWVFFYNVRSVLRGQRRLGLVGNGPIIVLREDGTLHQLSAARWRQELAEFEAALRARSGG